MCGRKVERPNIRRSSLASADKVTEKSTEDYICYTLHQQDSELKLTAVIIEAKSDATYHRNAVVQLMGYYLQACTKKDGHTVGLLLTETQIHVFLFPFTKASVGCVNAIWLQAMEYSENDILGIMNMLCLLAVITWKDVHFNIKLEDRFWPIRKDHTIVIQNEIEVMKINLEAKLKELEKEREMIAEEKRVMVNEKEEIAAKYKAFEIVMKKLTPDDIDTMKSFKELKLNK